MPVLRRWVIQSRCMHDNWHASFWKITLQLSSLHWQAWVLYQYRFEATADQLSLKFWENFRQFSNIFLGKFLKMHYFSIFSKNLINHGFIFRAFGRKTLFVGNFRENFHKNIAKMHYFCIFSKELNKPCVNFSRVWTKKANCWEILRNF